MIVCYVASPSSFSGLSPSLLLMDSKNMALYMPVPKLPAPRCHHTDQDTTSGMPKCSAAGLGPPQWPVIIPSSHYVKPLRSSK